MVRPADILPAEPPPGARVRLRVLARDDRSEFLALARESHRLHRPWTYPPERADQFDELYSRSRRDDFLCVLAVRTDTGAIAGVFTISQIVRGAFQSAYLGYYAHEAHARQGLMREALEQILDHSFARSACTASRPTSSPATSPRSRSRAAPGSGSRASPRATC